MNPLVALAHEREVDLVAQSSPGSSSERTRVREPARHTRYNESGASARLVSASSTSYSEFQEPGKIHLPRFPTVHGAGDGLPNAKKNREVEKKGESGRDDVVFAVDA